MNIMSRKSEIVNLVNSYKNLTNLFLINIKSMEIAVMKNEWKELEGLPEPGFYLFKNEKTGEVRRGRVIETSTGLRYWNVVQEPFNEATHWKLIELTP